MAAGGDLKSEAATTVGLDFMSSFAEAGKQFGYEVAKPVKRTDPTEKPRLSVGSPQPAGTVHYEYTSVGVAA